MFKNFTLCPCRMEYKDTNLAMTTHNPDDIALPERKDATIIEMNDIVTANTFTKTSVNDDLQNQKVKVNDICTKPCENQIDISWTDEDSYLLKSGHGYLFKKHAETCCNFVKVSALSFAFMLLAFIFAKFYSLVFFPYTVVLSSVLLWADIAMFVLNLVIYCVCRDKPVKLVWSCFIVMMLSIVFTVCHRLFYCLWYDISFATFITQDLTYKAISNKIA